MVLAMEVHSDAFFSDFVDIVRHLDSFFFAVYPSATDDTDYVLLVFLIFVESRQFGAQSFRP